MSVTRTVMKFILMQTGIELYEEIHEPTKIDDTNIKGQKIVDFDIGEEISVFLTGNFMIVSE